MKAFEAVQEVHGAGPYALVARAGVQMRPGKLVHTADEYAEYLRAHRDAHVYVALGTPGDRFIARAAEGAVFNPQQAEMRGASAIFLDLDDASGVHGTSTGLRTPTAADLDDALAELWAAAPPTQVRRTGGGRQAFWALTEHLSAERHLLWSRILNFEVRDRLLERGFKVDALYETSRLTRAPGSFNVKPGILERDGKPFRVTLAASSHRTYSLGELLDAFPVRELGVTYWPTWATTHDGGHERTPAETRLLSSRHSLHRLALATGFLGAADESVYGHRLASPGPNGTLSRAAVVYGDPDEGYRLGLFSDSVVADFGGRRSVNALSLVARHCRGDWKTALDLVNAADGKVEPLLAALLARKTRAH